MKKIVGAFTAGLFLAGFCRAEEGITIRWYGQSCFLLTSPWGTRVLMDPVPIDIGYKPLPIKADVVTISHEHHDHTNEKLARGSRRVIRGLNNTKDGWNPVDEAVGDVRIQNVGVYHDDKNGAVRGLNSIFLFDTGGMRFAHLGDLGHLLDEAQLKAIGHVDVLLIPVGGFYTIDALQATKVINQIQPKLVVIPMHYKTDVLAIKALAPVDAFLKGKKNVERLTTSLLQVDPIKLGSKMKIIVLNYR